MAIPVVALIIAGSMSSGGVEAALILLEGAIRETLSSVVHFVKSL